MGAQFLGRFPEEYALAYLNVNEHLAICAQFARCEPPAERSTRRRLHVSGPVGERLQSASVVFWLYPFERVNASGGALRAGFAGSSLAPAP